MKLLMHMCCAPCAVYPLSAVREEGVEVEGLFFNPNIHPYEEYTLRRENVEILSGLENLKVTYIDDFRQTEWEAFNGPDIERCTMCYLVRMDKAAAFAAQNGYDAFTTSLLVSPYQKHDLIRELGEKSAVKYGTQFFYRDFRQGFRPGQQKAKEMGLYRQKYCGCIISKPLQKG
ncbi:MAG: epoxyqueuosine reductase QueH [Clostridiales bacterium]|nr:epoxyqueuosine reductase QueH [Clostridiales bacterium]